MNPKTGQRLKADLDTLNTALVFLEESLSVFVCLNTHPLLGS